MLSLYFFVLLFFTQATATSDTYFVEQTARWYPKKQNISKMEY